MNVQHRSSHPWHMRIVAMALVAGMPGLASVGLASPAALDEVPESYVGPDYGANTPISPTRYEHQDKLWFHDDAWWALMVEPSGVDMRIFELLPDHTWRPTDALINISPLGSADVLSVDDTLYVVSRRPDSIVQLVRLTYDATSRGYLPMTTPPVSVTDAGSIAPPSIARDTTGRLWVALTTTSNVIVINSSDDGATWSAARSISTVGGGTTPIREAAAVVAFDRSIGVMWSDQTAGAFRFAVHRDGAPVDEWRIETAAEGPGLVDNHISLKVMDREPADAVIAAVKTAQGDQGEAPDTPLVLVLSRAPDGAWSSTPGATVEDNLNSPTIQIDATNEVVHLFGHAAGSVRVKQAPLDALAFPPGQGRPFVAGDGALAEASGSEHPVDARTGLVILASGLVDRRYHHAEVQIPGKPPPAPKPDTEAPSAPRDLVATTAGSTVNLYWSASPDGERWAPAAAHRVARNYVILRDGVEIGSTTQTSFADEPSPGLSYEYTVRAVDFAGNASPPSIATVSVDTPRAAPVALAAWTLFGTGAATAVALLAARRWAWIRT